MLSATAARTVVAARARSVPNTGAALFEGRVVTYDAAARTVTIAVRR